MLEKLAKLLPMGGENKKDDALEVEGKVKKDLVRYRRQFEKGKREEEEGYFGVIWKNTDEFRPFENHIFQIIEGEIPILSDSFPGTAVEVKDPAFVAQAKNLGHAIDWVYEDQSFQLILPMVIRDSLVTGLGYLHSYYDANAKDGEGQIIFEILPWRQVWLSGESQFIEHISKARFELDRTRDWLKLNYPDFADKIEKAKSDRDISDRDDREDGGRETADTGGGLNRRAVPKPYTDEEMLKLAITYKKDFTIVPIPPEETQEELAQEAQALAQGQSPNVSKWQDHKAHAEQHMQEVAGLYAQLGLPPEAGIEAAQAVVEEIAAMSPKSGVENIVFQLTLLQAHIEEHEVLQKENPKNGQLKYPAGWRVIETVGKIKLYDGPSKYDHNQIPLVPFYCYRNGTIYGDSEVRNILDSQRMQAVMAYKEYKGLQKVANPEKHVDQETGLTKDDITNEDGAVYILPQGTAIRNIDPGAVSPQLGAFQMERRRAMQDISGINEATQGKLPAPNASGVTVERTQQQAIGRVRLKDRQNQHYSIRRLGILSSSNILQFWTSEKVLRMEDKDGVSEQVIFNPLEMQDLEYEIKIAPGSMAGIDKDSFNAVLTSHLDANRITFDEYLQVAEMPRKEKLLELVTARMDREGQMAQLQNQNIELKGSINPELLTPEEGAAYEQLIREKQLQSLTGAASGQP